MRRLLYLILASAVLFTTSCALMDAAAGIKRDKTGKVISVDSGLADTGLGLLAASGGVGGIIGGVGGWALKAYRHKRIIDSGGKDDDFDGKPDPEPPKDIKTTPT